MIKRFEYQEDEYKNELMIAVDFIKNEINAFLIINECIVDDKIDFRKSFYSIISISYKALIAITLFMIFVLLSYQILF